MGNETDLPGKVGQKAEARSFEKGFRGAWFRCEITQVGKCTDGTRRVLLKYFDFDDDTPEWLKLYKVAPWKSKFKELMLRPPYPLIYKAREVPHASEISQVSVVVNDSWKVGDLVDWYTTGCFWSGTITKLLGDATAEIELHKPPRGEGLIYNIELKDVRPSLDWSLEYGWTMPTPTRGGDCGDPSAWLLKPINQEAGLLQVTDTQNTGQETEAGKGTAGSSSTSLSEEDKSTGTTDENKKTSTSVVPMKPKGRKLKSKSHGCRDIKTDSGQPTSAKPKGTVRSSSPSVSEEDKSTGKADESKKTSTSVVPMEPKGSKMKSKSRGCRDIKTDSGQLTSAKPKADDVDDKDQSKSRGCRDIKTDSGQLTSAKPTADVVADEDQSNTRGCHDMKTDSGQQTSANPNADDLADKNHLDSTSYMEKYTAGGGSTLNCTRSDTLEAAVLDLEEYVNKVKWLKNILRHGISSPNAPDSQWEFL